MQRDPDFSKTTLSEHSSYLIPWLDIVNFLEAPKVFKIHDAIMLLLCGKSSIFRRVKYWVLYLQLWSTCINLFFVSNPNMDIFLFWGKTHLTQHLFFIIWTRIETIFKMLLLSCYLVSFKVWSAREYALKVIVLFLIESLDLMLRLVHYLGCGATAVVITHFIYCIFNVYIKSIL